MKVVMSAVMVLVFATAAQAVPITYKAVLSGANENPAVATPGTGFATITYDAVTHLLTLDVAFSGLIGTTSASHIHCCTVPTGNAGVATTTPTFVGFPLGVTAGTYLAQFDLTLASSWNTAFINAQGGIAQAEAALVNGFNNGLSYLNIHSTFAPGGEIRGTILPATVPEPASLALLGLGLAGFAARRRQQA